jgi:hypothetical protein
MLNMSGELATGYVVENYFDLVKNATSNL